MIDQVYEKYSTAKIYGDGSRIKVGNIVKKSIRWHSNIMLTYLDVPVKYESSIYNEGEKTLNGSMIRLRYGRGGQRPFGSGGWEFSYLSLNESSAYQIQAYLAMPFLEFFKRSMFLYCGVDGGYLWIVQEEENSAADQEEATD